MAQQKHRATPALNVGPEAQPTSHKNGLSDKYSINTSIFFKESN